MAPSSSTQRHTTYFAYGSNLQIQQMATRCPDSRYLGFATLANHRWQINERGFANVVPDPSKSVEGLCYLLSRNDEARLDRNEGVAIGVYEKVELEVNLSCRPASLIGRDVTDIARDGNWKSITCAALAASPGKAEEEETRRGSNERDVDVRPSGEATTALVYLSNSIHQGRTTSS